MTHSSAAPAGDAPGPDPAAANHSALDDPEDPGSSRAIVAGTLTLDLGVEPPAGWPDAGACAERAAAAWHALATGQAPAAAPVADARPRLAGTASLLFADDATVRPLNAAWRGKDRATNVLSFPADDALPDGSETCVGDIVLARETIAREATEQGKTLADHTVHLILHGLLHLAGFDHESDAEAAVMEALERAGLAAVGIADPYAPPAAVDTAGAR
ncbi:putative rRNA maturation factor [Rhodothalassium salexigens DSM 2132]|uniref:Endoribonuclease YbeY n=1 Tax=Rhodothalassium salexigens DSM 2132 TaxID=1188247 RepID=A0A4V2SPR7_RHOSA|nr:rRNA maturation RNase YbeY [Rhodothalassium salexigens]MBB4211098.1 putative rRNA maturation factor [Rhodothalassium salexigens DSM 2132]MBK1637440.1 rRNA maturation RNase YbeY [Rhodothalassium salexigens DSM 2132]TCP36246.1 putative rRNA maturation factor [Rhodothalassium salexigens DSM 2132]